MRVVTGVAQPLSATSFEPFGWLPVDETDPADGTQTLTYERSDPHLNVIAHAFDEVQHPAAGTARCVRLYRHDLHTQALLVLNVPAVVAVAPAEHGFGDPADLTAVRAFRLVPLDCFVLHRGTWHWGPFPLGPEPVRLLNVQGRGYLDDNRSVDLVADAGGCVDVVTGDSGGV